MSLKRTQNIFIEIGKIQIYVKKNLEKFMYNMILLA